MKKIIFLIIIIFLVAILLFNIDYSFFREKTYLEKTHLKCLTGVSRDNNILKDKFGIVNIFLAWEDNFPLEIAEMVKENKSIFMITWEPYLKEDKNRSILQGIVSGEYDSLIRNFSYILKEYNHPVLLRWGHEMNGNWYSWSGVKNNKSSYRYIGAFQHIHDIFQQIETSNVKFVFSINSEDVPKRRWNRFENYYPGDEYVDLIGIDMYNWGYSEQGFFAKIFAWKQPENILRQSYERIIKKYPGKPIIISELGCSSQGGNKIKWMQDLFYLLKKRFKAVKAFVWFDMVKERDWGISQDEEVWEAYKEEMKHDFFTHDIKDLNWIFNMNL